MSLHEVIQKLPTEKLKLVKKALIFYTEGITVAMDEDLEDMSLEDAESHVFDAMTSAYDEAIGYLTDAGVYSKIDIYDIDTRIDEYQRKKLDKVFNNVDSLITTYSGYEDVIKQVMVDIDKLINSNKSKSLSFTMGYKTAMYKMYGVPFDIY